MKKAIIIIFFAVISVSVSGQNKKFNNAFVVSLSGDTISGQIQMKNSVSLCQGIKFKKNDTDSTITFNPFDISSFCFTDKKKSYKSLKFKNNSKELIPGFGELLFDDEIKLYKFYQRSYEVNGIKYNNDIAYVIETDSMNYNLLQTRSVKEKKEGVFYENQKFENSKSFNLVVKEYLGMLSVVFKDCPEISESIYKVNFNDQEIIEILEKYLKCKRENNN
ncbi:MAG: hypothetical protein JNL03_12645 [Prolixibacteraceae bacterium]|nr:hypothetical protein [Prolixibacteraceae bacterium]